MTWLSEKSHGIAWFYIRKRYKLRPQWTRVMVHGMYRRPSWNTARIDSGSRVIYAPVSVSDVLFNLCGVFSFLLGCWHRRGPRHLNCKRAQYKQRLWHLSPLYCKKEVRFLQVGHVTHVTEEITRFEESSQLAFDLLSTACDTLRSGFRPGLQLARIMECGPNWRYQCSSRHFFQWSVFRPDLT